MANNKSISYELLMLKKWTGSGWTMLEIWPPAGCWLSFLLLFEVMYVAWNPNIPKLLFMAKSHWIACSSPQ